MSNFQQFSSDNLAWQKMDGLIPTIIQHAHSGAVLMLGYMNQEALQQTIVSGEIVFYSRSKQRLWRKGETSGNSMTLVSLHGDCDGDSLLIQVIPKGPSCHQGWGSCFQPASFALEVLALLIDTINKRATELTEGSYTASLIRQGLPRCAQKVGEEAIETIIAATTGDKDNLINECADLIFHLLVLLQMSAVDFYAVLNCLHRRFK